MSVVHAYRSLDARSRGRLLVRTDACDAWYSALGLEEYRYTRENWDDEEKDDRRLLTPDEELSRNSLYGKSDERADRHFHSVYKECKFVEDEGDVVFYKNAYGLAKMRPVFNDATASDSGVEVDK
ncbi:Delta12-fatty acid desaturase [Mycena venus]|uniref:Delta12-fatty acid desaturase n=1 Tax=Mycena venus TaxID=2733690 RepID=A0A8H7D7M9_9AGAR|nr:Delta12-fatty acid desaturase [Mycena venus]